MINIVFEIFAMELMLSYLLLVIKKISDTIIYKGSTMYLRFLTLFFSLLLAACGKKESENMVEYLSSRYANLEINQAEQKRNFDPACGVGQKSRIEYRHI